MRTPSATSVNAKRVSTWLIALHGTVKVRSTLRTVTPLSSMRTRGRQ